MEESSEEWHDARGNMTRQGSTYSSVSADDSFHSVMTSASQPAPPATNDGLVFGGIEGTAAATGSNPPDTAADHSSGQVAARVTQDAAAVDEDVEAELQQLEAEAQLLHDPELEAELQQFEQEMAPLNKQLDMLQKQLAETAVLDREGAQQLQLLHSKLSNPTAPRQKQQQQQQQQQTPPAPKQPAASAKPTQQQNTSQPVGQQAAAAPQHPPPPPAAAEADEALRQAASPEPTPYCTPIALSPATPPSGQSAAAAAHSPRHQTATAAAAASSASHGVGHTDPLAAPPSGLLQQGEAVGSSTVSRPGHSRAASGLSFGSLLSEPQLESLGPGSRSDSGELMAEDEGHTTTTAAAAAASGSGNGAGGHTLGSSFAGAAAEGLQPAHSTGSLYSSSSSGGSKQQPQQPQAQQLLVRQGSVPVSPKAMAAVAPAALAPPRSDLDLRRLSSSPEGSGEGASSDVGDAWAAWAAHRRHFFVLTSAGKPVYSLHGDEGALAGFMAIIQAVVSVVADQGDCIRGLCVGPTQLVVLLRGHLYLVAVSSRGEPQAALRQQLHLLHQAILMVITNGVEKLLGRNPSYDVRQLLAGSAPCLTSLLSSYSSSSSWLLQAVEPAPGLSAGERAAAGAALQSAVTGGGALYGVLLAGRQVVAVACGRSLPLHPADLLLLANFANGNAALRQAESFTPLCLPNFQPSAMLHAYVGCLEPAASVFLLLLGASPGAFHTLAAQRVLLEAELLQGGLLMRLRDAAAAPGGGRPAIAALPPPAGGLPGRTCCWHYLVHWPAQQQCVAAAWPSDLLEQQGQQEEVLRSYARLYCTAHGPVMAQQAAAANTGIGNGAGNGSSSGGGGGDAGPASSLASSILGLPSGMGSSGGATAMAAAATAASYVLPYAPPRPARLVWVSGRRWVSVASMDKELELYVTLDPLTDADLAGRVVEVLRRHYSDRAVQANLLIPPWQH